jgi:hypothetical protein
MKHHFIKKKKNGKYHHPIVATTVTLLALALLWLVSGMSIAPIVLTASATTNNATTTSPPTGIKLGPQPVWQEHATTIGMAPINRTHMDATFSGDGTLTMPNSTENIIFTTNGTGLISLATQSAQATETIVTEDGETAKATFYEIVQFNPASTGEGKGITIAVLHTNSTGALAPLNGMILAGIDDMSPDGESNVTLWEWESDISNSNGTAPPLQEESSVKNATSAT